MKAYEMKAYEVSVAILLVSLLIYLELDAGGRVKRLSKASLKGLHPGCAVVRCP